MARQFTLFRGLFIGVDRYVDTRIPWLAGAGRDATALHALFSDAVGGSLGLLTDAQATRDSIRAALQALADGAGPDDVVVVSFAGHGSDDHRLLPFDADAADLPHTCIALDELADLLSAIPGSTLVCILDCCFSGGLGARVFSPPLVPRRAFKPSISIDVLDRFVGEGRVVITASADDEEALESPRHGHGLLTYRVLEALQGVPAVCVGNQVSLYKVVEYVTEQVQADARRMGYVQTPALRGRLEGSPYWPILTPGALFDQLFPGQSRTPASADLASLKEFGLADATISAWQTAIPSLNDLQLAAINEYGLLDSESLVVTAPTSSGKTMIGELAALRAFSNHSRAIFLLPTRALVNDKYQYFQRTYGPLGLRTVRATGEHSDEVGALLGGQFDIALLTYEKYSALTLGFPHVLDLAATMVVDEAQILADRTRGANLEFVLTLLNSRRETTGSPQIITLSAVVGDLGGLDVWLGAKHLHTTKRPVDLEEGVLDTNGGLICLHPDGSESRTGNFVAPLFSDGSRRVLIPLLQRLMGEGKKVLVFRQSRSEAAACATYLSQSLGLPAADATLSQLPDGDLSRSSATLRRTLNGGVAFHTTDLDREERAAVEDAFRSPDSDLRVVVATPTLAMGVNTPASAVAIVGLTHPGAPPTPFTVAEYKNMVGRAGRLGYSESGESYLIPEGGLDVGRAWSGYVTGSLENLRSQLVPDGDPRSLMLRVFAALPGDATASLAEAEVVGFLDMSFAAFQARRDPAITQWTEAGLRQSFNDLVRAQLVTAENDRYRLTRLGRFAGESGVHVDSILRLSESLRSVVLELNSVSLITAAQLTNELDDVYLPVNARGKNTELPRWPRFLMQQAVPTALVNSLTYTASDQKVAVRRAKRAAAATMWIDGQVTEAIEAELNRHMPPQAVAGAIRSISERTRDLLPAVSAVVQELAPTVEIEGLVERTMLRLELGIPAALVDLASVSGITLSRPQWLRLRNAGLISAEAVLACDVKQLGETLGSGPAASRLTAALKDAPAPTPPMQLAVPTE